MRALTLWLMLGMWLANGISYAEESYRAAPWLPGGHLQTIVPYLLPPTPSQTYTRERWELPDGDFIDADWTVSAEALAQVSVTQPTVILFHGLEGNSQSHYARTLMAEVKRLGWVGVVAHFRGCTGEPNRLPRVYYAGDAQEIDTLINIARAKRPQAPLFAIGVSLGGNALLKWLGEYPEAARQKLVAAAAISAPIALKETAHSLDQGWNYWLYSKTFVATMKPKALAMAMRFPEHLDAQRIQTASTVQQMDDAVTAPLFGALDAEHYYEVNAAKPWLKSIEVPTLVLNAQNDPFVPFDFLPTAQEVSASVTLEYPSEGGHAGFPGQAADGSRPWLGAHVLDYLQRQSSPDRQVMVPGLAVAPVTQLALD